jgi:hypothetical protein
VDNLPVSTTVQQLLQHESGGGGGGGQWDGIALIAAADICAGLAALPPAVLSSAEAQAAESALFNSSGGEEERGGLRMSRLQGWGPSASALVAANDAILYSCLLACTQVRWSTAMRCSYSMASRGSASMHSIVQSTAPTPPTPAQSHASAATDRVAALGRLSRVENERLTADVAMLTGRARRMARRQHTLLTACPSMPEALYARLERLATYGGGVGGLHAQTG